MTFRSRPFAIAVTAITAAFGFVLLRFTVQPTLASFADDSASYLVMAQVWSPWAPASAAVRDVFVHEAFYPPLFPLLLAAIDAGGDLPRAHASCAVLLACSLPLLYLLGERWLGNRAAALAAAMLFALLPGVWLNAKGILSEPLFLVVLLALLLELGGRRRGALLAVLFAALVLTRAIGCAMAAAYIAWAAIFSDGSLRDRVRATAPGVIGIGVYALWLLLRPVTTSDDYASFGTGVLADFVHAPRDVADRIIEQAGAFADGWSESLLIYWTQGGSATHLLALVLGAVALIGWLLRLRQRQADAALLGGYAGLLLIWPFPGQMLRFLLPLLPMFLLYAFVAAGWLSKRLGDSPLPAAALTLCIASLCAPALIFLKGRADAGQQEGYAAITEWYGSADVDVARARAQTHLQLFAMLDEVRKRTTETDRVAWFAPAYVALLSGRLAAPLPSPALSSADYRRALAAAGATYALLSVYHPRDTVHTIGWQAGVSALSEIGPPLIVARGVDGNVYAALWQLKEPGVSQP